MHCKLIRSIYQILQIYTGTFDFVSFQGALLNPERTMLGATQKEWFINQMNSSSANWQILGQQVLMGKMFMPAELLILLGQVVSEVNATGSASEATFLAFQTAITELAVIKTRLLQNDSSLTVEETARVTTLLPYNLDAWDGYFMERESILTTFEGKKVVVLAGDTHNAWQSDLNTASGVKMGTELATSSVSSPGFETYLGSGAAGLEQALQLLIDDLNYSNFSQRGFMKLTVNTASITSEWNYIDSVTTKNYTTSIGNTFII